MRDRLFDLVALTLGVVVVAVGAHACAEHLGYVGWRGL